MEVDKLIRIKEINGDYITLIKNANGKQITSKVVMVNSIFSSIPNNRLIIDQEDSKIFLVCDIDSISYFGVRTKSGEEYLIDTNTIDNYKIK